MKRSKPHNVLLILIVLSLGILFVIKFAGPSLLRLYVETGVGSCKDIPIFCMGTNQEIIKPSVNQGYLLELVRFDFNEPIMEIFMPKNFTVYKNEEKEVYFRKFKRRPNQKVAYLLYRKPNFFINLFPEVTKAKVKDDYDFLMRTMNAKLNQINGIVDTFFVIMKGIFIPDLGDQSRVRMTRFAFDGKRGFINYNLSDSINYFDCNILNSRGEFFKLYIRDPEATLDLDKVFTIISTIKANTLKPPR